MPRYDLTHLSNPTLLRDLDRLVANERSHTADLLAHLAEVDRRKLYLDHAASSLFTYCVEVMRYSEDSAYKRIQAARAATAYPVIFDLIARGELHLSAVTLLAPHLRPDNHRELLEQACHRSKREVEQLVAARFPRPELLTTLRRLPEQRSAASAAPPGRSQAAPAEPPAAPPAGTPPVHGAPSPAAPVATTTPTPTLTPTAPALMPFSAPTHRGRLEPLSSTRFRLAVTLGSGAKDHLEQARDLLSHSHPGCDLSLVIELALEHFVTHLTHRKLGRRKPGSPSTTPATRTQEQARSQPSTSSQPEASGAKARLASSQIQAHASIATEPAASGAGAQLASRQVHAHPSAATEPEPSGAEAQLASGQAQAHPSLATEPEASGAKAPLASSQVHAHPSIANEPEPSGAKAQPELAPGQVQAQPSTATEPEPSGAQLAPGQVLAQATDMTLGLEQVPSPSTSTSETSTRRGRTHRSRYIPVGIKREVTARDGSQCTFTDTTGRRCSSRSFLEYHHLHAVARGGATTADNLTLRCAAHNAHQARLDFGAELIERRVAERARRSEQA